MSDITTEVVKSFNGGHQVRLSIDHQSFLLEEKFDEDGLTSLEYANWYKKQLDIALRRIANPNITGQFCECVKPEWDGADVNGDCVHCGKKHNPNTHTTHR